MPLTSDVPRLSVPIDPRIRRRRIEVRRSQGRRRLRVLVAVVLLLALTGTAWLLLRSPLLDVDTISIGGAQRTDPAAIWRASGVRSGVAMVDVDESRAARKVEALPWVAEAAVRRHWPNEVSITVTERSALAALRRQDSVGWVLLDASGRVLEQVSEVPAGLVPIEGIAAAASPGTLVAGPHDALRLAAALSEQLAGRVAAIRVMPTGELELQLAGGGTVRLGAPSDLDRKLSAAETMLASVDSRGLAVLDVRIPASPVLTRA